MKSEKIIMTFDALGNDTRLKLFRLLVKHSDTGLNQTELSLEMGNMPRTTLCFHLDLLKNADLCFVQKVGKAVIYKPNCAQIKEIAHYLLKDCCEGQCSC